MKDFLTEDYCCYEIHILAMKWTAYPPFIDNHLSV